MALNIPGLLATIVFYIMVLGIGLWASVKSKRERDRTQAAHTDMALLGDRNVSLVVGIFTTTGESESVTSSCRTCRQNPTSPNSTCSQAGGFPPAGSFKFQSTTAKFVTLMLHSLIQNRRINER